MTNPPSLTPVRHTFAYEEVDEDCWRVFAVKAPGNEELAAYCKTETFAVQIVAALNRPWWKLWR